MRRFVANMAKHLRKTGKRRCTGGRHADLPLHGTALLVCPRPVFLYYPLKWRILAKTWQTTLRCRPCTAGYGTTLWLAVAILHRNARNLPPPPPPATISTYPFLPPPPRSLHLYRNPHRCVSKPVTGTFSALEAKKRYFAQNARKGGYSPFIHPHPSTKGAT
jgi:hypothetical protein